MRGSIIGKARANLEQWDGLHSSASNLENQAENLKSSIEGSKEQINNTWGTIDNTISEIRDELTEQKQLAEGVVHQRKEFEKSGAAATPVIDATSAKVNALEERSFVYDNHELESGPGVSGIRDEMKKIDEIPEQPVDIPESYQDTEWWKYESEKSEFPVSDEVFADKHLEPEAEQKEEDESVKRDEQKASVKKEKVAKQ
jgi:hypothetical protein